ncbi:uncharacterized protein LOC119998550 [Tripterygium wilfordii]|uniref:uncharacterized protein LOC119998550 n=1 Tax=Tripterygium wilfordii TaxID=458696 RepID=UPI0018F7F14F|nr:uncharacterized protein LOC119998550 [Tripterygium wilfordii]
MVRSRRNVATTSETSRRVTDPNDPDREQGDHPRQEEVEHQGDATDRTNRHNWEAGPSQVPCTQEQFQQLSHQGFKSMMECQGANALIMCKIFPSTLFGPARTWFNQLPRHSITSFGDLSEKLALHFFAARRTSKTSLDLMNLDHEPGESLRSFLARFNRACLEIPYVQVEVAISALVRTVTDEAYVRSLTKKRQKSMGELYARGDKFMQSEDMMKISHSLHNILLEVSHMDILKWPKKMRAPTEKRTSDKYCLFHKDHGHDTEECRHLKDEIEGLIRRGYLKQFTSDREEKRRRTKGDDKDDDRRRQRRRDRSPRHQRETARTIGVIVGGLATGGESSSARRAYARINEDPHDDALVVEAVIANFTVKKVLVDNGSAADILLYHAFREMKISEDKLKIFLVPLYGFAGESIIPNGVISLPVTLGTYPRTIMHMIDLLVVDVQSPYNAIIGRPLLHKVRAVVSTYHLRMKFPASNGVGEVKRDQRLA